MLLTVIRGADLLLGALLTGAMFGVWLSFNPARLSPTAYVLQQQQGVRTLHPPLPILGGMTILLTLISAGLTWPDQARAAVLLGGALSYVVAGLITRLVNLPINSVVLTWSAEAPPTNWGEVRERWWYWHRVRTAAAVCGLCLLIAAAIQPALKRGYEGDGCRFVPQAQPDQGDRGSSTESRRDSGLRHLL